MGYCFFKCLLCFEVFFYSIILKNFYGKIENENICLYYEINRVIVIVFLVLRFLFCIMMLKIVMLLFF